MMRRRLSATLGSALQPTDRGTQCFPVAALTVTYNRDGTWMVHIILLGFSFSFGWVDV